MSDDIKDILREAAVNKAKSRVTVNIDTEVLRDLYNQAFEDGEKAQAQKFKSENQDIHQ